MSTVVDRTRRLVTHPRDQRTTALVAVQHLAVREIAIRVLRGLGAQDVVAITTPEEARRAAAAFSGQVAVVEAGLADGAGVALARDLRASGWTQALVVSTTDDPWTVRAALSAGVRCYLTTTDRGGLVPELSSAPDGLHALSEREVEVLHLVGEGRSNRDVGERLGLSALTVKSHLARIARKVGTGDRAEMVLIALRAGLIS